MVKVRKRFIFIRFCLKLKHILFQELESIYKNSGPLVQNLILVTRVSGFNFAEYFFNLSIYKRRIRGGQKLLLAQQQYGIYTCITLYMYYICMEEDVF